MLKGYAIVAVAVATIGYCIVLGFIFVLPVRAPERYGLEWWLHFGGFTFLAGNFFFNYFSCLCTDPGTHGSAAFERLIGAARARDLLSVDAPPGDDASKERDDSYLQEADRGGWLLRDPFEWGWCTKSGRPKPPRAHYCTVVKQQVLIRADPPGLRMASGGCKS
jgi:hypothetical protein